MGKSTGEFLFSMMVDPRGVALVKEKRRDVSRWMAKSQGKGQHEAGYNTLTSSSHHPQVGRPAPPPPPPSLRPSSRRCRRRPEASRRHLLLPPPPLASTSSSPPRSAAGAPQARAPSPAACPPHQGHEAAPHADEATGSGERRARVLGLPEDERQGGRGAQQR